jgi:hypothetical protein
MDVHSSSPPQIGGIIAVVFQEWQLVSGRANDWQKDKE